MTQARLDVTMPGPGPSAEAAWEGDFSEGPPLTRTVPIDKASFTIGRSDTNDLRVTGTEASRTHAEILTSADGFILRDRGSRYGTYVNGDRITIRGLADGDRIALGSAGQTTLVFHLDDSMTVTRRITIDPE